MGCSLAVCNTMYLNPEVKGNIFAQNSHSKKATDTGSPESQVALWTFRIAHLTEHLKRNRGDKATQRGLISMVGKRKRMLAYLQRTDINRYRAIIKQLNLRG
jgi:small subunit ribosomal protein S15